MDVAVIILASLLMLGMWYAGRWGLMRLLILVAAPPEAVRRFGHWARVHPLRSRFKNRLPRVYALLAARLEPRRFQGLPLTLMLVAGVYAAALFGGLIAELREADELIRFDQAIDAVFSPWRGGLLESVFLWITQLGDSSTLVAVIVAVSGLLWGEHRFGPLLPLWITILGSQATTWVGKYVLARQRPEFVTAATAVSPSFPSAHATGALAVYGFLAYLVARGIKDPRRRFDVAYWTLVVVGLVGVSRVFLSVHYASDVAGGFLVGGFWLLVGFTVAEWRRQGPPAK